MEIRNFNHIKATAETFDKCSERYEGWFSREEGEIIKESEKKAVEKLIPEGRGLEVGVGSGIFASSLGVEYGIDPSKELLQLARSRGVKSVLGIAEMLPFKPDSFDFSLYMFTLSFLADPLEAFRETMRVLKPEGELIVCFITKNSQWGEFYRKKKSEGHDFYRHGKFYSLREVKDFFEKSGFSKNRAVSTLFQRPGSVNEVEEPREGIDFSAGLCCIKTIAL